VWAFRLGVDLGELYSRALADLIPKLETEAKADAREPPEKHQKPGE
jgi:hypothetical protein